MLIIPGFIIGLAVLPAIVLACFIYKKDYYKEPLHLLAWAFIMGMMSAPCSTFFSGMLPPTIDAGPFWKAAYTAFLQAAVPEELTKFLFLYALIWNNRRFDEMFDGIVYATYIGLGFAAMENILYVAQFGTSVLVGRAILSVPGHFFFAVAMGFFFGIARFFPRLKGQALMLSLVVPILLHGMFDFLLMWAENLNNWFSGIITIAFYVLVVRIWKRGFRYIIALQGK